MPIDLVNRQTFLAFEENSAFFCREQKRAIMFELLLTGSLCTISISAGLKEQLFFSANCCRIALQLWPFVSWTPLISMYEFPCTSLAVIQESILIAVHLLDTALYFL